MNRLRLATLACLYGVVSLGLLGGCCGIGNGQILARLGFCPRCDCCPVGCNDCNGLGRDGFGTPLVGPGNTIPPTQVPPVPQTVQPPPADPNRLVPQATPIPAGPTGRNKQL